MRKSPQRLLLCFWQYSRQNQKGRHLCGWPLLSSDIGLKKTYICATTSTFCVTSSWKAAGGAFFVTQILIYSNSRRHVCLFCVSCYEHCRCLISPHITCVVFFCCRWHIVCFFCGSCTNIKGSRFLNNIIRRLYFFPPLSFPFIDVGNFPPASSIEAFVDDLKMFWWFPSCFKEWIQNSHSKKKTA